jgi:hypothetical protein
MLTVHFSPYTTGNLTTKIIFTTTHQLPGKIDALLEKQAEFPVVPTSEHTMRLIHPLIDMVIVNPDAVWFLRPVDPIIDHAESYNRIVEKPMDLSLMRKKALTGSYTSFDQFISDMDLLVKNAILYNSREHKVHQASLRLSFYFRDQLSKIEANPGMNPFESSNSAQAEARLGMALVSYQRAKKEAVRAEKNALDVTRVRGAQRQAKKITEAEMETLVQDIKKLKSGALLGVVEIIAKKPFKTELLPLELDLSTAAEEGMIERLKTYVDSCKEGNGQYYYSWRPQLPDDLQEIRDKYEAELLDWMKPPRPEQPA